MNINELEKAVRKVVEGDSLRPLISTPGTNGVFAAAEFSVAADTLVQRSRKTPDLTQREKAEAGPWL